MTQSFAIKINFCRFALCQRRKVLKAHFKVPVRKRQNPLLDFLTCIPDIVLIEVLLFLQSCPPLMWHVYIAGDNWVKIALCSEPGTMIQTFPTVSKYKLTCHTSSGVTSSTPCISLQWQLVPVQLRENKWVENYFWTQMTNETTFLCYWSLLRHLS